MKGIRRLFSPGCLWISLAFIVVLVVGGIVAAFALTRASSINEALVLLNRRLTGAPPPAKVAAVAPTARRVVTVVQPTRTPKPTSTPKPTQTPTRTNTNTLAPTDTATTAPTNTATKVRRKTATPTDVPAASSDQDQGGADAANTTAPVASSAQAVVVKPIAPAVKLSGVSYDYQKYNNCGPTTLHMYLSFFGHSDTQLQIAAVVKPDPKDKNVNPWQLVSYAKSQGLDAIYRINGNMDRLKTFLSNGLPVVAEMGFIPEKTNEGWMGHYRLLTGYNDKKFIMQDSYLGPDYTIAFDVFDANWKAFNRTYWVVYKHEQAPLVQAIIGKDMDDTQMYTAAVERAQSEFDANPNDGFAAFNLGSSYIGLKKYAEAAEAYDRARSLALPWRMMWYQFGPYEAYYQVGRYDDLIALADATLKGADDLEESHYYKGLALEKLGRPDEAKVEFTKAIQYNKYYSDAQRALAAVGK